MSGMHAMHKRERPVDLSRPLLRTSECARIAVCDDSTIRRAIQFGQLRALRLGPRGDYRIPAGELDRWMRGEDR
jgi:excisionase family DNA binding protein